MMKAIISLSHFIQTKQKISNIWFNINISSWYSGNRKFSKSRK